jgi:hypothetical protein
MHRETWPTVGSLALPTKDHLSELLAKALDLLRIRCGSKVLGKFEEGFLLLFLRLDTFFQEFNQHSIGAQASTFCHAADLGCHFRGKSHALANSLVSGCHDTSMHHSGAKWSCFVVGFSDGNRKSTGRKSDR